MQKTDQDFKPMNHPVYSQRKTYMNQVLCTHADLRLAVVAYMLWFFLQHLWISELRIEFPMNFKAVQLCSSSSAEKLTHHDVVVQQCCRNREAGGLSPLQLLADQLALYQPGREEYPSHIFRPSYGLVQAAVQHIMIVHWLQLYYYSP